MKRLDPVFKMRMAIHFMERNVVPLGFGWPGEAMAVPAYFDINKVLATMPPDEARLMRRKFRKMWRKAAKKLATGGRARRKEAREMGLNSSRPTRAEKNRRKQRVFGDVIKRLSKEADAVQTSGEEG